MSWQRYDAPAEKPYELVSVEPLEDKHRDSPAGHAAYRADLVSGRLEGEILVRTPLHVGSGTLELTNLQQAPLVKAHVRSGGRPVIPGSSLKGAIRSIVEAISPSCVRITTVGRDQLPRGAVGCRDPEKLCLACRMFGSLGYQGQVSFGDAVLRKGHNSTVVRMPALYAPRKRAGLYTTRDGTVRGRKFYRHGHPAEGETPTEVCPPGAWLDFDAQFENLKRSELGLLLLALGQGEPKLYPKLGGGKPTCYGSVEIRIKTFEVFAPPAVAYVAYEATPGAVEWQSYLGQAGELISSRALAQLAKVLQPNPGYTCPEGNY